MSKYNFRTIFFLLDTSESMEGAPIFVLNSLMRYILAILKKFILEGLDIRMCVLAFNTNAHWVVSTPCRPENFKWRDYEASGLSNIDNAYKMLYEKLSEHNFCKKYGDNPPTIILVSLGNKAVGCNTYFKLLRGNFFFNHACRFAVDIPYANKSVLENFTGCIEAILRLNIKYITDNLRYALSYIYHELDEEEIAEIERDNVIRIK